ncbi:MAG: hypothetical protein HON23_02020 [Rickettsiales bacterium]|jgi:hypothetical protein|nr:hypothetical protein [Rickettsiales bacterium]
MNDWGGKREGSGRPKGRLNNKTSELIERVEEKYPDWCPIEQLAKIANDEKTPLELQIQCCLRVASYVYSKPKIMIENPDSSNLIQMIMEGRKRSGIDLDN